ncbi:glutaredoxin family protein [Psychromonas sp. MME2]|uniref:glutaredoxin family protein n=1 Tax=unclassified Psychromonas TaxID=2614957 RepID=UPI00339D0A38
MTNGAPLLLYFTDGCHLCDDAVRILQQANTPYTKIDIIHSQALVDRYGYFIPVLEDERGNSLYWPFDLKLLNDFLHIESNKN